MITSRPLIAPPAGVTVYESSHAYIAENPQRAASRSNPPGDLGGWDFADGFRLSEPDGRDPAGYPVPESEWRISMVCGEIYAVLRKQPRASLYTFDGPVWLVDEVPAIFDLGGMVNHRLRFWLDKELLELKARPDSLVLAVQRIRSTFELMRILGDPFVLAEWSRQEIERFERQQS